MLWYLGPIEFWTQGEKRCGACPWGTANKEAVCGRIKTFLSAFIFSFKETHNRGKFYLGRWRADYFKGISCENRIDGFDAAKWVLVLCYNLFVPSELLMYIR